MSNPWLHIPLADYEGHMSSPSVGQLQVLSDLFAQALQLRQPASVAVAGVAGGNGLDRIDSSITHRVVGIDINPNYLQQVRTRYPRLPGLELQRFNLSEERPRMEPVELVHAALILEHAGLHPCLDNMLAMVAPQGACSVVLQLPGEGDHAIGPSGFESLQNLKSSFSLIPPDRLRDELEHREFSFRKETQVALPGGKAFWMGIFECAANHSVHKA